MLEDLWIEYTDFISTFYCLEDGNFIFILDGEMHIPEKVFSSFLEYKKSIPKDLKK